MKKLIASILTLCTVVCFTACGGEADKTITEADLETWSEQDFEDALEALESAEASVENSSEAANDTIQEVSYEATEEIINAKWDSGLIQINDQLIQLPLHLSDLLALGYDYQIDLDSKSLVANGENICYFSFQKTTEGSETLESNNPLIEKIDITTDLKSNRIWVPGGLTIGDSYELIEEKLGKATEIQNGFTYKYGHLSYSVPDLCYGMQVIANQNTQQIVSITVGKSLNENSINDLTTITFQDVPNVQTSDSHNVSLLLPPIYKQIPGVLVAQRIIGTVLDYEGTNYYMNFDFSFLGEKYANPYEFLEYGDPIWETTVENGMTRKIYNAGYAYIIICSTDVHRFKAVVTFKNLEDASADSLAIFQDLVINIANSVQY